MIVVWEIWLLLCLFLIKIINYRVKFKDIGFEMSNKIWEGNVFIDWFVFY